MTSLLREPKFPSLAMLQWLVWSRDSPLAFSNSEYDKLENVVTE